jgi:hypothetical protein
MPPPPPGHRTDRGRCTAPGAACTYLSSQLVSPAPDSLCFVSENVGKEQDSSCWSLAWNRDVRIEAT